MSNVHHAVPQAYFDTFLPATTPSTPRGHHGITTADQSLSPVDSSVAAWSEGTPQRCPTYDNTLPLGFLSLQAHSSL